MLSPLQLLTQLPNPPTSSLLSLNSLTSEPFHSPSAPSRIFTSQLPHSLSPHNSHTLSPSRFLSAPSHCLPARLLESTFTLERNNPQLRPSPLISGPSSIDSPPNLSISSPHGTFNSFPRISSSSSSRYPLDSVTGRPATQAITFPASKDPPGVTCDRVTPSEPLRSLLPSLGSVFVLTGFRVSCGSD
ncbi:hypothetical protein CRG98_023150 [Punica granatum]|uniref:Uncharacterized protein n=1 Tax=Punica granatum TaxID=22663 RepID=A0A2I0JJT3_PUNGR|nr:hypothetical protein CRG98_023150 [Punica granatum]